MRNTQKAQNTSIVAIMTNGAIQLNSHQFVKVILINWVRDAILKQNGKMGFLKKKKI